MDRNNVSFPETLEASMATDSTLCSGPLKNSWIAFEYWPARNVIASLPADDEILFFHHPRMRCNMDVAFAPLRTRPPPHASWAIADFKLLPILLARTGPIGTGAPTRGSVVIEPHHELVSRPIDRKHTSDLNIHAREVPFKDASHTNSTCKLTPTCPLISLVCNAPAFTLLHGNRTNWL